MRKPTEMDCEASLRNIKKRRKIALLMLVPYLPLAATVGLILKPEIILAAIVVIVSIVYLITVVRQDVCRCPACGPTL